MSFSSQIEKFEHVDDQIYDYFTNTISIHEYMNLIKINDVFIIFSCFISNDEFANVKNHLNVNFSFRNDDEFDFQNQNRFRLCVFHRFDNCVI